MEHRPESTRRRASGTTAMRGLGRLATIGLVLMLAGCAALEGLSGAPAGTPMSRQVPARTIPVPSAEVSPQMQAAIAQPFPPTWNADPRDAAEWKALIDANAAATIASLPALRERFKVKVEQTTIGGVNAYWVIPANLPARNRNRLLVHVHGGGYVFGPGEAATREAILMAGFGGFRVLSIDYRMPPDHPFPAAMDDAMAAWRAATKLVRPRNMAIFGTSTGGAMTLAMVLRAKDEKLPRPAVIAPGTPWSDLAEIGDSYFANEYVDNVLVSWKGWLGKAAALYAAGADMRDPQLSPIHGDMRGFPPTILTSGTRDLFLSNTVRVHRKLRRAGVVADLHVYEGQSHAQYGRDVAAPETREAFEEIARFFDRHLGR